MKWVPGVFLIALFCTACSPAPIEEAESVFLNYWESAEAGSTHEDEYLYEPRDVALFAEAAAKAVELEEQKTITTEPLLSFEILTQDEESRNYHLWLTEKGEGFLQSLSPADNTTLQLEGSSIEPLQDYLQAKEGVLLLKSDIEFE